PPDLSMPALQAALDALLDRHEALRLCVSASGALEILPAAAVPSGSCLQRMPIAQLGDVERARVLKRALDEATARLDPAAGNLVQAVWADAGPNAPGRLVLVIHHLAVDGVSWRILTSDLASAYAAAVAVRPIVLEAVPTG